MLIQSARIAHDSTLGEILQYRLVLEEAFVIVVCVWCELNVYTRRMY
jgi:hypothetical protein